MSTRLPEPWAAQIAFAAWLRETWDAARSAPPAVKSAMTSYQACGMLRAVETRQEENSA